MGKLVEKAYRYRYYPSDTQKKIAARTFGCCRFVFNYFLDLKSTLWKEEKKNLSYVDCSRLLTSLKEENSWLKDVSSVTLQQSLRHLDNAFSHFFNKIANYPSFKTRYHRQSATYMKNSFVYKDGEIWLAKDKEPLKIKWSRRFKGKPTSLTITRDCAGRYYISILVKEEVDPLPFKKSEIGLDLGLKNLMIDNRGNVVHSPSYLKKDQKKIHRKQRSFSRKQKGSKNREKERKELACLHAKIRDKRHDFLHKLSWQVVNENQVIAVESLSVKNMMKNKRLSNSIADAGWATFVRFLEYKSDWYGKELVAIDPFFPSSKRCSNCGNTIEKLELETREWECSFCRAIHDRDVNAAKNILSEGLRLLGEKTKVPWGARDIKPVEFV